MRIVHVFLALLICCGIPACDNPRDGLRTWRPTDHDNQGEVNPPSVPMAQPNRASSSGSQPRAGMPDSNLMQSWARLCVSCHGRFGRGDGPNAAGTGATDLSNPAWQNGVTDDQIRAAIAKGMGAMPAFALDGTTLQGLVGLIRQMRVEPPSSGPPQGAEDR